VIAPEVIAMKVIIVEQDSTILFWGIANVIRGSRELITRTLLYVVRTSAHDVSRMLQL
jgi:hypothetical protein